MGPTFDCAQVTSQMACVWCNSVKSAEAVIDMMKCGTMYIRRKHILEVTLRVRSRCLGCMWEWSVIMICSMSVR